MNSEWKTNCSEALVSKSGSAQKIPYPSLPRFQVQLRPHTPVSLQWSLNIFPSQFIQTSCSPNNNPSCLCGLPFLLLRSHPTERWLLPVRSTNLILQSQCLSRNLLILIITAWKSSIFSVLDTGWFVCPISASCRFDGVNHSTLSHCSKLWQGF